MTDPGKNIVPNASFRGPELVRIWRWSVTPKTVRSIKIGGAISLLTFAGWLFQNFLQLRGVVHLLASRIDLIFLSLALFGVCWLLTIGARRRRTVRIIGGACLLLVIVGLDWWAPKPLSKVVSFVYLVPGVWVGHGPDYPKMVSWDFIVNHRGPEPSYNVEILFVDEVKRDRVVHGKTSLTPAEVDSYQLVLKYPEIDPKGRGSIFAKQFIWTPPEPDHERYSFDITWRDGGVHQDLQVERAFGSWFWATQIRDRESAHVIVDCKDKGFPYGERRGKACFPEMTMPGE